MVCRGIIGRKLKDTCSVVIPDLCNVSKIIHAGLRYKRLKSGSTSLG